MELATAIFMKKILYLWDLAGTLFLEKWDREKSGFESYADYVKSLGYDLETISPQEWEWAYERPFEEGYLQVSPSPGFREVLSWTKNNAAFTTGNREQIDWRAGQILPKYGFDIRDYLKEIHSTFDYGNTNKKTPEMLQAILRKKFEDGFDTFVYTDDKLENSLFFQEAAKDYTHRVYHFKNDNKGLRSKDNYLEIGSLLDLI